MAMLCADEYPELDINKVIKMCLIHDFGEAITGDVPAFLKTETDEINEKNAIKDLLSPLPDDIKEELLAIFQEMHNLNTDEAKLYKALDNMEALISHNEADISTWLPLEYEENLTYGQQNCEWSEWTKELKRIIMQESIDKINREGK